MNILEIWELFKMVGTLLLLLGLIVLTIHQAITGDWYGVTDKVHYPWEKEDRRKAKEEEKRRQNRKWYEN